MRLNVLDGFLAEAKDTNHAVRDEMYEWAGFNGDEEQDKILALAESTEDIDSMMKEMANSYRDMYHALNRVHSIVGKIVETGVVERWDLLVIQKLIDAGLEKDIDDSDVYERVYRLVEANANWTLRDEESANSGASDSRAG